jgi:hypothetical protein
MNTFLSDNLGTVTKGNQDLSSYNYTVIAMQVGTTNKKYGTLWTRTELKYAQFENVSLNT